MTYEFNFVADAVLRDKAYPALTEWPARPYTDEWRQFGLHWPYTVPCDLHEHCATHNHAYQLRTIKNCQGKKNFYCIGLGFFDFSIDYFALVPKEVFDREFTILFYYDEGDNPKRIKQRLDALCVKHKLSTDCYRFISANTVAGHVDNFVYFPCDELLYWHRNKESPALAVHTSRRPCHFTLLSRTHKWWRATVVADLHQHKILDSSMWSYNTNLPLNDDLNDNPIQVDTLGLTNVLAQFVGNGPYTCDQLTTEQHNDHHITVPEHYTQSYCNIVLETHFDADQSGGAFLNEKTFKPIKHGQPFVIAGGPGSLQALRDLGYRTFDHAIDNSYDLELDNTQRWLKLLRAIQQIKSQDMHTWFLQCIDDIKHNQQLFLNSKKDRLNTLYDKLLHQLATS
jgi:hypothetical protein